MRTPLVLKCTAIFIATIACIHTLAWFSVPDGLGFNPHPWYLASLQWLRALLTSLPIPTSNLEVGISYFFYLPAYLGILLLTLIAMWWSHKKRSK